MGQNQMKDPETWVDEHGDSLFRYALFRIQDAQVAEDLVQETSEGKTVLQVVLPCEPGSLAYSSIKSSITSEK